MTTVTTLLYTGMRFGFEVITSKKTQANTRTVQQRIARNMEI